MDYRESVSSHRQRDETVRGLEEKVRQLQRELGEAQTDARAQREQLSSLKELIKA